MPASANGPTRRRERRYVPTPMSVSLTRPRLRLLLHLAECRILSLPQLARLMNLPQKSTRRQMRLLFNGGYVHVVAVGRAALAGPGEPNDALLLFGSAPNIYTPTPEGLAALEKVGLITTECRRQPIPAYGPKNSLFVAHELWVREVRVFLTECQRRHGGAHRFLQWKNATEAAIELGRAKAPQRLRPDAWFAYQFQETPRRVLSVFVEADRGTERGTSHWEQKVMAYQALFTGERLAQVTGYQYARVLTLTPDASRRDFLAGRIGAICAAHGVPFEVRDQFWLMGPDALTATNLEACCFRQSGFPALQPFLPPLSGS